MNSRWGRWAVLSLALVALAVASSSATTVIAKSFRSLSVEAEVVFAGTVGEVRPYRRNNGRIWTAVRFVDVRWLAGDGGGEKELHFAGGRIDDRAELVGGMPSFVEGQRAVLFVRDAGTASPIVGFHQGCFGLRASEVGETVVTLDGRPVLGIDGDDLVTGEAGERGGLTLEAFSEVVGELRGQEVVK